MIYFIVKLLVDLLAKPVVKRGLGVLFNRSLTPEEEEDFTEMVTWTLPPLSNVIQTL
jgi:hypothetical protein